MNGSSTSVTGTFKLDASELKAQLAILLYFKPQKPQTPTKTALKPINSGLLSNVTEPVHVAPLRFMSKAM
ncbi:hypothetical protein BPAE_0026g00650 [Botrytis paeoniae]|uniref:Uncharacterized protein n=1 Tax=Botrytis paeoniae TaxID=278948 RepID=A0A4Z1FVL7_9HELO|nr:hypothetical protein BPAE_0026g00650 [Botrytis paeoniae]